MLEFMWIVFIVLFLIIWWAGCKMVDLEEENEKLCIFIDGDKSIIKELTQKLSDVKYQFQELREKIYNLNDYLENEDDSLEYKDLPTAEE